MMRTQENEGIKTSNFHIELLMRMILEPYFEPLLTTQGLQGSTLVCVDYKGNLCLRLY